MTQVDNHLNNELRLDLINVLFRSRNSMGSRVYNHCEVCERDLEAEYFSELDHEMQLLIDKNEPIFEAILNIINQEKAKLVDRISKEVVGEDEKIRWDDYKDNVALSQANNKVRAAQRTQLNRIKQEEGLKQDVPTL